MSEIDKDGSGKIDFDEFLDMMRTKMVLFILKKLKFSQKKKIWKENLQEFFIFLMMMVQEQLIFLN